MGQQINQKTLVFIKPDAMARNLAGEIIARFQRVGLKIINCKMMWADKKLAEAHYPVTDEWLVGVGNHTLDDCKKYGYEAKEFDSVVGDTDFHFRKYKPEWGSFLPTKRYINPSKY